MAGPGHIGVDAGVDVGWETIGARLGVHLRRRKWALVTTLVSAVVSLAFPFVGSGPVVRYQPTWALPGDLW
jgi:hypothetical protein